MSVSQDIRDVPRPKNSVVFDSGSNGPKRYSVRMHNGYKKVEGKAPQPTFGPVIGYIVDHTYVPVVPQTKKDIPDIASYGSSALVHSVVDDLYPDLLAVFPPNEALTIMALAAVRVVKPSISNARAAKEYQSTFLQVFYPGAALSENTIGGLLEAIGQNSEKQAQFYGLRLKRTLGDHLAIDGTLITDESRINDLSAYSRKSRIKNSKDVSLMYAYDIEKREPACASVFPGNRVDTSAYPEFIRENNIHDAIIINDTGFSVSSIREELKDRPDLHYLTPLKRNDSRITNNGMLLFDRVLMNTDEVVYAHREKIQVSRGRDTFLYSFCNTGKANAEFKGFGASAKKARHGVIDPVDYAKKRDFSGVIVFESDLEAEPGLIYQSYKDRWLIELAFRRYKNSLGFDATKMQSDYSVIGSSLVNYVSTVITCRIINKAERLGILDQMTYGDMMEDLFQARRKTNAPEDPVSNDNGWSCAAMIDFTLMEKLGLSRPAYKIGTGRRGRPPKKKPEVKQPAATPETRQDKTKKEAAPASDEDHPAEDPEPVKRGPGRPRIHPRPDPNAPKRKPGRPRKYPLPDPNAPKRKPGRPRKYPLPDPDAPKRGPGRPRKEKTI